MGLKRAAKGLCIAATILALGYLLVPEATKSEGKTFVIFARETFTPCLTELSVTGTDQERAKALVDAEVQLFEGEKAAWAKDYDKAHNCFNLSMEKISRATGAKSAIAALFLCHQAIFELTNDHFAEAESAARHALAHLPEKTPCRSLLFAARFTLIQALDGQGKRRQMIPYLEANIALAGELDAKLAKAGTSDPLRFTILTLPRLAYVYGAENDQAKEKHTYETLLTVLDKEVETAQKQKRSLTYSCRQNLYRCLLSLGLLEKEQNQYGKAIAFFTRANQVIPLNPRALQERSRCYLDLGQNENALADANQAVQLSADRGSSLIVQARVLEKCGLLGRCSQGITASQNYAGITQTARYERAQILMHLTRYKEAIEDFTKCQSGPIEYPHLRSERGEAYYLDHQYEKALVDYEAALNSVDAAALGVSNFAATKSNDNRAKITERKQQLQALLARMPDKKPLTPAHRTPGHGKGAGAARP